MRRSIPTELLMLTAVLAGCNPAAEPSGSINVNPAVASPMPVPVAVPMTLANCASAGCHGGPLSAEPSSLNASSVWLANDPHRNAFLVLYTKEGRDIVERLKGWNESTTDNQYLKFLEQRCTGCHAVHDATQQAEVAETYALGVTCTACHGDATHWGHEHYVPSFRAPPRTGQVVDPKGFHDLRKPEVAAKTCVKCHVGPGPGPGGALHDMNHDIIAAGHPRLEFEYHAYRAHLPRHWEVKAKTPNASHFKEWLAGQQALAEQRTTLTTARKASELFPDNSPITDFSEVDCFRCHHSFASAIFELEKDVWVNWRQLNPHYDSKHHSQRPTEPVLLQSVSTWELLGAPKLSEDTDPVEAVLRLFPLGPPPKEEPNAPAAEKQEIILLPYSWEQAVQALLAVDALLADHALEEQMKLRSAAGELRSVLNDSLPAGTKSTLYDSPSKFAAAPLEDVAIEKQKFAHAWKSVRDALVKMKSP